jgi:hypothetical protein
VGVVGCRSIKRLGNRELLWNIGSARGYWLFVKVCKYKRKQGYRVDVVRKATRKGYRTFSNRVCENAEEVIDFLRSWGLHEYKESYLRSVLVEGE